MLPRPGGARLPRTGRLRGRRCGHYVRARHQRGAARLRRRRRDDRGIARARLEPAGGNHRRVGLLPRRPSPVRPASGRRTGPGAADRGGTVGSLGLAPARRREGSLRGAGLGRGPVRAEMLQRGQGDCRLGCALAHRFTSSGHFVPGPFGKRGHPHRVQQPADRTAIDDR